jgi:hypothetical protein
MLWLTAREDTVGCGKKFRENLDESIEEGAIERVARKRSEAEVMTKRN